MTDYQEQQDWDGHYRCPHCGSSNIEWVDDDWDDDRKFSWYRCYECGAEIQFIEILEPYSVEWNPPEEPEEDDVETEVNEPVLDIPNAKVPRSVVEEISNILTQIRREEGHNIEVPARMPIYTLDGNLRYPLMWERLQSLYDNRKRAIECETRIRVKQGNGRRLTDEAIEQAIEEALKKLKEVYEPKIARMKRFEEAAMEDTLRRQDERVNQMIATIQEATNTVTEQDATHTSVDDISPVASPVPHAKYAQIFRNLSPGG